MDEQREAECYHRWQWKVWKSQQVFMTTEEAAGAAFTTAEEPDQRSPPRLHRSKSLPDLHGNNNLKIRGELQRITQMVKIPWNYRQNHFQNKSSL